MGRSTCCHPITSPLNRKASDSIPRAPREFSSKAIGTAKDMNVAKPNREQLE